jgi:hypothetical protein
MTSFNDLSSPRPWPAGSPQSSPPALEEQPAIELMSMANYIDFPDPEQGGHGGFIMHYSNPPTPPSDGGYKEETMTQESVDRWTRSLNSKFTEDSSDSVRPSPPSSSNGEDINPFHTPDDGGLDLTPVETKDAQMASTLNEIDL